MSPIRILSLLLLLVALTALPTAAAADPPAALRGDANRDGIVDVTGDTDTADQRTATVAAGILVLPNVDDDAGRCPAELRRVTAAAFDTAALAACHDGADTVVDGARDAADLAPLRVAPWPEAPDGATGEVSLTGPGAAHAHLFRRDGNAWTPAGALTAADLRGGVELGLEANDVVRDPIAWDGRIAVRLTVRAGGGEAGDDLVARVAPVLFVPQTAAAERVFARAPLTDRQIAAEGAAARRQAQSTARFLRTTPRKDVPPFLRRYVGHVDRYLATAVRQRARVRATSRSLQRFDGRLRAALGSVALQDRLTTSPDTGLFVQDDFESGYAAVPAPGGTQTMRVTVLATKAYGLRPIKPTDALAAAVTWPWRTLRGPDAGVVAGGRNNDEWDANGDLEATPPGPGAPRGRLLVGSPRPSFRTLLDAQEAQPRLSIDTSWLAVGHVDELFAFVPSDTARGWSLVVADPAGALKLLRTVPRGERVRTEVVGRSQLLDRESRPLPPQTVARLLAGPVVGQSERAARKVDAQLATVRRELGLTDADVVRVPVLFGTPFGEKDLIAWTGNIVNGFAPGGRRYLAVAPHGPVRRGSDLFAAAAERALRAKGIGVTWVDTWTAPHSQLGELHCYTNALRALNGSPWWR